MANFALREITTICGVYYKTYQLVVNGVGAYDEFLKEFNNPQYESEIFRFIRLLESCNNGQRTPPSFYKDVTPKGERTKEYEYRTKNLRIYAIQGDDGRIIIIGGQKNNQEKDFRRFRSLKQQYLDTKNKK